MDEKRFLCACEEIVDKERERVGIGTLCEKTVHAVLKHYFEPDEKCHEVRLHGYVADIVREDGIVEIQTGNFNTLRNKLKIFLEYNPVTIVYPIPRIKWLSWIDEETGEVSKRRKSPKKGTPYMAFRELYKIKAFLPEGNLKLCIVMIDVEEYRLLNGWSQNRKKGSSRHDRIPLGIVDEIHIDQNGDFVKLIPMGLQEEFDSRDFRKATGLSLSEAQTGLNILYSLGVVERIGKKGNAFIYRRSKEVA